MTGKTISTGIYKSVTIGKNGYLSPLTITSKGIINADGQTYGAPGILLPSGANATATIVNAGHVFGNLGSYANTAGLGGGGVVLDSAATLANSGLLLGGVGGSSRLYGGAGGNGVYASGLAIINNTGTIGGGAGGYAGNPPADVTAYGGGGAGGAGVELVTISTLTNSGTVDGGNAGQARYNEIYSEFGGVGVIGKQEAVVVNSGDIYGGLGSGGVYAGSTDGNAGGTGIALYAGGNLNNSGTVIGGGGGDGNYLNFGGAGGTGVLLYGAAGTNSSLIAGGDGGHGTIFGGQGGYGVLLENYAVFTNIAGLVAGGYGGAGESAGRDGGIGMFVFGQSTATNDAVIYGGAGGKGSAVQARAGYGGAGVLLAAGKFVNNGTVVGGGGGIAYGNTVGSTATQIYCGAGGAGIGVYGGLLSAPSYGTVLNYGLVRGGAGGFQTGYAGTAAAGGEGVILFANSMLNKGTIIGGLGGYTVPNAGGNAGVGGGGGDGVYIGAGGTFTNSGVIIGGRGGAGSHIGASGGYGVLLEGGTLINNGTVTGGAGGDAQTDGTAGDAIGLTGSVASVLVLGANSKITGDIVNLSRGSVLELSGSSATALAGIGSQIIGFANISFATGATRTVEGSVGGLNHDAISGFAAHESVIIDGFTASLKQTTISNGGIGLSGTSGSISLFLGAGADKDYLVTEAGGRTTLAAVNGTAARTVGANSAQFVASGGLSTGSTLSAGAYEEVSNGGTAASTKINGGALELKVGAMVTGGVTFGGASGGLLLIDSATPPTGTISGFIAGDTIALAGIVYNPSDKLAVTTAGTLNITGPGVNAHLVIAGAMVGETDFHFGAGSLITRAATPKAMSFIAAAPASVARPVDTPTVSGAAAGVSKLVEIWLAHGGLGIPTPPPETYDVVGHTSMILHDDTRLTLLGPQVHPGKFG